MTARRWVTFAALLAAVAGAGAACSRGAEPPIDREAVRWRNLGLAHLEDERLEAAEAAFRRLIELRPDDGMGYGNLGVAYLRQARLPEAEAQLRRALELGADPTLARLDLAEVLRLDGRTDEAEALLAELDAAGQAPVRAGVRLARMAADAGDWARAADLARAATEADPANLPARMLRVESLLRRGTAAALDEATRELERVRQQVGQWTPAQDAYLERALEALRADDAPGALAAAIAVHNLLRPSAEYRAGIRRIDGRADGVAGWPFPRFATGFVETASPTGAAVPIELVRVPLAIEEASERADGDPPAVAVAADLDGDGTPELVRVDGASGRVRCFAGPAERPSGGACGAAEVGHAVSEVTAADLDGDDDLDLVAVGPAHASVLRREPDGFVAWASHASDDLAGTSVVFDLDQDGDLDVLLVRPAQLALLRNLGDGRFDAEPASLLDAATAPPGDAAPLAVAADDLDRDGDLDLVVASAAGIRIYDNRRQGRFADVTGERGAAAMPGARTLALADHDGDGWVDLFVGGSDAAAARLYRNAGGGRFVDDERSPGLGDALGGLRPRTARFVDLDNDGWLDLFAGDESGVRVLRNHGDGRFASDPRIAIDPAASARASDVGDHDGDGDLDLWLVEPNGRLAWLRNDGGNANPWLAVQLVAMARGSGKNNRDGLGAQVELRAGAHYQTRLATGRVTHFGLGAQGTADVLRIVWPNGQAQTHVDPVIRQTILEEEILKGSCPFVYAWNGERIELVTDLLWRSALGMPLGIMGSSLTYGFASSADEHVRIPPGALVARDGALELRITEELWESPYFDEVELIAVDHPATVELRVHEGFQVPPDPPFEWHLLGARMPPVAARDLRGRDQLEEIRAQDGRHTNGLRPTRYQGIEEPHGLELDLGPAVAARGDARVRLVLVGWLFPTDASINVALAQAGRVTSQPPSLEIRDAAGTWRTAVADIGFPEGKRKTVIVDLSDHLAAGEHVVRVRTNMRIHWDVAFATLGEPDAPMRRTTLEPMSADLHYRGFSRMYRESVDGPHLFAYDDVDPAPRWRDLTGSYTRYGDVTALLADADDRYAILNAGDEMTVRFDADALPHLPEGWTRTFVLFSDGWIKDGDLNTAEGWHIEPLHRGMGSYPYPTDEGPDAATRRALDAVVTRPVTTEPFRTLLLE